MESHTLECQTMAFRLMSRAGCSVEELLAQPHRSFPIKLFRILAEPETGPDMAASPDCVLGPWAAELKRLRPDFTGPELEHKLALVGALCPKDISPLEARHATSRRVFTSGSVQTHTKDLQKLSSEWLHLQFRRRAQKLAFQRHTTNKPKFKVRQTC